MGACLLLFAPLQPRAVSAVSLPVHKLEFASSGSADGAIYLKLVLVMKRTLSPASELGPPKKARIFTKTSPSDELERDIVTIQDGRPPEQVQMSILRWEGWPTVLTPESGRLHGEIGTYESAAPDSELVFNLRSWNEDTKQAQYVPENGPVIFNYERHAWVGSPGDGCGIVGDNMPVKVRVCLMGGNPWPQVLTPMIVLVICCPLEYVIKLVDCF